MRQNLYEKAVGRQSEAPPAWYELIIKGNVKWSTGAPACVPFHASLGFQRTGSQAPAWEPHCWRSSSFASLFDNYYTRSLQHNFDQGPFPGLLQVFRKEFGHLLSLQDILNSWFDFLQAHYLSHF